MPSWESRDIHDGWSFKRTDHRDDSDKKSGELAFGEGFAVREFPTTVHVELLKQKKIPDPVCVLCSASVGMTLICRLVRWVA